MEIFLQIFFEDLGNSCSWIGNQEEKIESLLKKTSQYLCSIPEGQAPPVRGGDARGPPEGFATRGQSGRPRKPTHGLRAGPGNAPPRRGAPSGSSVPAKWRLHRAGASPKVTRRPGPSELACWPGTHGWPIHGVSGHGLSRPGCF